jgi:hypothetical protein
LLAQSFQGHAIFVLQGLLLRLGRHPKHHSDVATSAGWLLSFDPVINSVINNMPAGFFSFF